MRDDLPAHRGRHQHLLLQPDPRGRRAVAALFLSRIVLVPVIAAVAYELVRFGARHYGNALVRAIYRPGCGCSRSPPAPRTTMLEVSIACARVVPGVGSRGGRRAKP